MTLYFSDTVTMNWKSEHITNIKINDPFLWNGIINFWSMILFHNIHRLFCLHSVPYCNYWKAQHSSRNRLYPCIGNTCKTAIDKWIVTAWPVLSLKYALIYALKTSTKSWNVPNEMGKSVVSCVSLGAHLRWRAT